MCAVNRKRPIKPIGSVTFATLVLRDSMALGTGKLPAVPVLFNAVPAARLLSKNNVLVALERGAAPER